MSGVAFRPNPWHGDAIRSIRLPEDLERVTPGPDLAALLSGLDRSRVSGFDLTRLLEAESRLISHFQAGMYETMIELDTVTSEFGSDAPAAEISTTTPSTTNTPPGPTAPKSPLDDFGTWGV